MLQEVVDSKHRVDSKTFMDDIVYGHVPPLMAIFVGYLFAILPCAVVGTASVFPPSLILLTATVPYSDRFLKPALFQGNLNVAW